MNRRSFLGGLVAAAVAAATRIYSPESKAPAVLDLSPAPVEAPVKLETLVEFDQQLLDLMSDNEDARLRYMARELEAHMDAVAHLDPTEEEPAYVAARVFSGYIVDGDDSMTYGHRYLTAAEVQAILDRTDPACRGARTWIPV